MNLSSWEQGLKARSNCVAGFHNKSKTESEVVRQPHRQSHMHKSTDHREPKVRCMKAKDKQKRRKHRRRGQNTPNLKQKLRKKRISEDKTEQKREPRERQLRRASVASLASLRSSDPFGRSVHTAFCASLLLVLFLQPSEESKADFASLLNYALAPSVLDSFRQAPFARQLIRENACSHSPALAAALMALLRSATSG